MPTVACPSAKLSRVIALRSTLVLVRVWRIAALAVGVVMCVALVSPVAAAAATLRVTTARDELIAHDGRCALREAIEAVESPGMRTDCGRVSRGSNTIVLGSGRYVLTIPAAGADDNTSGDLNVHGAAPLTITGAGPRATMINAGALGDRVLSAASGARLLLSRLSIAGGRAQAGSPGASGVAGVSCAVGGAGADGLDAGAPGSGGGIFNGGRLVLDMVEVTGNMAGAGGGGGSGAGAGCNGGHGGRGGSGGGVYSQRRLTLIDSTVSGNRGGSGGGGGSGEQGRLGASGASGAGGSGGLGGSGGGIFSEAGLLTVIDSTLYGNTAGAGGAGGPVTGRGGSGGNGGGIAVAVGSSRVRSATVAGNGVGTAGASGSSAAGAGAAGAGGGLFVRSTRRADNMRLQTRSLPRASVRIAPGAPARQSQSAAAT